MNSKEWKVIDDIEQQIEKILEDRRKQYNRRMTSSNWKEVTKYSDQLVLVKGIRIRLEKTDTE